MGRQRVTNLLLNKLFPRKRDPEQTEKVATALLQATFPKSNKPLYLKGVHNGRFYRVKLNAASFEKGSRKHPMPRLPGDGEAPHAFKKITRRTKPKGNKAGSDATARANTQEEKSRSSSLRLPGFLRGGGDFSMEETVAYARAWWKENWSTVVLNFGSVCTLIGFTRSDVLELRCLSVTGSAGNVIYHFTQAPLRYLPVAWSALFAAVNSYKIREILLERHSQVHMTPENEDTYIQFFMPRKLVYCTVPEILPDGAIYYKSALIFFH
jgi:hypothetical protein